MWYIFTMEYYAVMKKNELRPLAATWMDPGSVTLRDASRAKKGNIVRRPLYVESKNK